MKILKCDKCGCERELIIKAKVRRQEAGFKSELGWLCIPCFLEIFRFYDRKTHKIDYEEVTRCVRGGLEFEGIEECFKRAEIKEVKR